MNTGQPKKSATTRSRLFFIIGVISLVLMALLWSLDAFFVYILLGAATFFLFLGYLKTPGTQTRPKAYTATQQSKRAVGKPSAFSDVLRNLRKAKSALSGKQAAPYFIFFSAFFLLMIVFPHIFPGEESLSEEARDHYQKAQEFRWESQFDSADYYYHRAMKEDPENVEILTAYGAGLLARNDYDKAMTVFNQALQLDPDYAYARYNIALIHYYRNDYKRSLSETFELMERNPEYSDATLLAGDNYYSQQRYDSAIYWYQEGYDEGQRSAVLCHLMGYIYDQQGNQQKAVQFYQEALSYDSTKTDIYTRLGELLPGQDGERYRLTSRQLKSAGD